MSLFPLPSLSSLNPTIDRETWQLFINLDGMTPISLSTAPIFLFPYVCLYFQAYFLLKGGERGRLYRMALWPLAVGGIIYSWLSLRFSGYVEIYNFTFGCANVYFLTKSTEWAFTSRTPVRLSRPTTSATLTMNAWHLCLSTRMVGWSSGIPLRSPLGSWTSQLAREAKSAFVHYVAVDICCYVAQVTFPESIGTPKGGSVPDAINSLIAPSVPPSSITHTLLYHTIHTLMTFHVGMTMYQSLCFGYHLIAFYWMLFTGSSSSEWPPLMSRPWAATSLLDFWSHRWHRIFKHAFLAPISLIPASHPKLRHTLAPLSAFTISSLMHELGILTFSGHTAPYLASTRFFLSSAVGAMLEMGYKRLTGRRVKGWMGWVWTYVFLAWTGRWVCDFWLEIGVGGTEVIPGRFSACRMVEGFFDRVK